MRKSESCSNEMFVRRKERVTFKIPLYVREIPLIHLLEHRAKNLSATNHIHFSLISKMFKRFRNGMIRFNAGNWARSENNIATLCERVFQRLVASAAHQHRVSLREPLEAGHIFRNIPRHFSILADDAVTAECGDDDELQVEIAKYGLTSASSVEPPISD